MAGRIFGGRAPQLAAVGPLALAGALQGCRAPAPDLIESLQAQVDSLVGSAGAEVAVFFRDLGSDDSLLVHPDLRMHAASTMKVPVMMRLFLDRDAGAFALEDSLEVTTTFHSIVDGSPFVLPAESDSDTALYLLAGQKVSYRHLIEEMITISSNLATNILIREADPRRVTALVRSLGADSMDVLRGVEDLPAFQAGLSNTTTARDLGVLLTALARGEVGSPETCQEMVDVMLRQRFNSMIPAGLPEGVPVAHKTGSITGISHDGAVVYPPGAPPFVLVVLTRGFPDPATAEAFGARLARLIYDFHQARYAPLSS